MYTVLVFAGGSAEIEQWRFRYTINGMPYIIVWYPDLNTSGMPYQDRDNWQAIENVRHTMTESGHWLGPVGDAYGVTEVRLISMIQDC